jgi:hypothetical protein
MAAKSSMLIINHGEAAMNIKATAAGLVGVALVLVCGCSRGLPEPPDPGQARQALISALEAWQRGEKAADLQSRDPALHVADADWRQGCQLQGYKILHGQEDRASSLRVPVSLSLRDSRGKTTEKRVAYLVGTRPAITIIRED